MAKLRRRLVSDNVLSARAGSWQTTGLFLSRGGCLGVGVLVVVNFIAVIWRPRSLLLAMRLKRPRDVYPH